jgi:hypothetical protein
MLKSSLMLTEYIGGRISNLGTLVRQTIIDLTDGNPPYEAPRFRKVSHRFAIDFLKGIVVDLENEDQMLGQYKNQGDFKYAQSLHRDILFHRYSVPLVWSFRMAGRMSGLEDAAFKIAPSLQNLNTGFKNRLFKCLLKAF